jgi:hypothetical protein
VGEGRRAWLALPLAGAAALAALRQESAPVELLPEWHAEIRASDLEHHVRFLAADELAGRAVGSPGEEQAARYVAAVLERLVAILPAEGDGYLQRVPLVRAEHSEAPELSLVTAAGAEERARYGVDFRVQVRGEPLDVDPLPLRVARAAADLSGEADAAQALFLDGTRAATRAWLAERGVEESRFALVLAAGPSSAGDAEERLPRGRLAVPAERDPADVVVVRGALLERLRAGEIARVGLRYRVERSELDGHNVVGWIEGAGTEERPELAEQVVVLSAHLDHIGTREAAPVEAASGSEPPDLVYNGADDDASGVAALLEIAEAFSVAPRPARTVVFLFATGEEAGLLGTHWYLDHPVAPLARTVANLNFEMVGRPDAAVGGPGRLWLTGFERTTLGPAFAAAGLAIAPDPRLEQRFYERSDNYAFVRRGVIGQTLSSYDLHEDYHTVDDEADRLDYAHMEAAVRAAYEACRLLADGAVTPAWSEPPADEDDEKR